MRSASSGLTATLLMFVPLLAVPFLAAFGVSLPTSEMAAGAAGDALDEPLVLDAVEMGVDHSVKHTPDDLFAPFDGAGPADIPGAFPPADGQTTTATVPAVNNLHNASLVVDSPASQAGSANWDNPFAGYAAFDGHAGNNPHSGDTPAKPSTQPLSSAPPPQPMRPAATASRDAANARPRNPFDFAETASPRVDESAFQPGAYASRDGSTAEPNPVERHGGDGGSTADFFAEGNTPARTASADLEAGRTLFDSVDGAPSASINSQSRDPQARPTTVGDPAAASRPSTPEITTWSLARRRLQELGIDEFALDPGENDERYFFRCVCASTDDPRIRRQFEAEGAAPLDAVRRVIAQVEAWHAGR